MAAVGGWFYEIDGTRRGPVSLLELKQLVLQKAISPTTPVFAEGMPAPVPAGRLPMLFPPPPDGAMRWLLPVGRSGFAIAAGYLALCAFIPFAGALALVFAALAIRDLRRHPEKSGWGRVIFALVVGSVSTFFYALAFLR